MIDLAFDKQSKQGITKIQPYLLFPSRWEIRATNIFSKQTNSTFSLVQRSNRIEHLLPPFIPFFSL
jgi:hypothetical protein